MHSYTDAMFKVKEHLSAGPDERRRLSLIFPQLLGLGSSTGPEETRTGGRRLDSELQEDQHILCA